MDARRPTQNFHPEHIDIDAAKALGHPALVAPPTFMFLVAFVAQRRRPHSLPPPKRPRRPTRPQLSNAHSPPERIEDV
ncbi:MaoC family dehydratase N-terminal domain-containing protein [Rhodococcus sp. G-MC3]|uniref:FAS1-like dehydratase domain-containing protein n=1 Tax=Rhodococcus sp. G-MC3 TaxID=3046209 RepID=UPI0024BBC4C4|nr:MaoC family dehydratase N-terminal domain-containing protein [Rhodococcus sp. G-MC3]MDJ0394229.1 MaoC family dehydratase N-terminal domain-containing protein [Rhodococcus sp. G-MC3]